MLIRQLMPILGLLDDSQEPLFILDSIIGTDFTNVFVKRLGDTVYVYINKVLVGSGIVGLKHLEMDSDNQIGLSHFNTNPFQGELKLLRFYNFSVGDTEREAVYDEENI